MIDENVAKRLTRDHRFRMLVDSAVAQAFEGYPNDVHDAHAAKRIAHDIAIEAVANALHRAFEGDAELHHAQTMAEHYKLSALKFAAVSIQATNPVLTNTLQPPIGSTDRENVGIPTSELSEWPNAKQAFPK